MANNNVVNTNVTTQDPSPSPSETVPERNIIVNTNVSMPDPSMSESLYGRSEWNGTWFFFWGIIIVIFILFFITRKDDIAYGSIPPQQLPPPTAHAVQTNVAQDKLYIVNPNTGLLSVVDTKTDQIKTMLPFK